MSPTSRCPEWLKSPGQPPAMMICGQGLGAQTPTLQEPTDAGQRVWVMRRQTPELQQAPGVAQVLGVQVPPGFQSCAAAPQVDCRVMAQVPVTTLQQRPGRTQGFGVQTPDSDQVLPLMPPVQRVCVRRMQVPAAVLQQTPGAAQVLGVQVPPRNQSWAATVQVVCVVMAQVPVTTLQQRPGGGGQGLGVQTPADCQVLPEMQRA